MEAEERPPPRGVLQAESFGLERGDRGGAGPRGGGGAATACPEGEDR